MRPTVDEILDSEKTKQEEVRKLESELYWLRRDIDWAGTDVYKLRECIDKLFGMFCTSLGFNPYELKDSCDD